MASLQEMVASLRPGQYKDHFTRHLERGMHPSEARFARYAILSLAPGERAPGERAKAARYILRESLQSLPPTRSGEIFAQAIEQRFPGGVLEAGLQIEEMLFIANIASALAASPACQAEEVLGRREDDLLGWATVSGREPARPMAIQEGLLWLYYMNRDLRGVCIHSLPGRGLPVVFVSEEEEEINLLRAACHEMIHSSQRISTSHPLEGWPEEERRSLLEAVTEGLAICRIPSCKGLSPREIPQRDYAYFFIALFARMKESGIALSDFPKELERMNSDLSLAAAVVGSPESWAERVQGAMRTLLLGYTSASRENDALGYIREMIEEELSLPIRVVNEVALKAK